MFRDAAILNAKVRNKLFCDLQQILYKHIFNLSGVISEGRTVLKYHANSNSMLSFGNGQPVRILSKGDGTQQDIWGVEVSRDYGLIKDVRSHSNVIFLD